MFLDEQESKINKQNLNKNSRMKSFIAGKVLAVSVNHGGETMADSTPSVQWGTART